jgi:hypothetical protein
MEMPGWRWMLLVLLLGGQRLKTSGIAVLDSCLRGENAREHRITTKEANSKKAPKIAEEFESAVKDRGSTDVCIVPAGPRMRGLSPFGLRLGRPASLSACLPLLSGQAGRSFFRDWPADQTRRSSNPRAR